MNKATATLLIRILFVVVLILLGIFLFAMGKTHTVLLDNKTIEYNGKEYKAIKYAVVIIDNQEEIEITQRERLKVALRRSNHTITIEDNKGNEVVKKFKIPLSLDISLLSLPLLMEFEDNQDIWLSKF